MKVSQVLIAALASTASVVYSPGLWAQSEPQREAAESTKAEEIAFSADSIDYNFDADIVTANGSVVLNRDGYALYADKVVWNRKTGEVTASGAIKTVSPDGDIAYGDSIIVTDTLRDGIVENLLLVLEDGGRLAAKSGDRSEDGSVTLTNAAYTACAVVDSTGCPKNPSWQIKAVKVRYDPVRKRVSYDGARIEIFGLPVIPLPGLAHPVGNEFRSGILVPDLRLSTANGVELAVPYYFNLASNQDLTVTGHVFTDVLPMVSATYRRLDKKGAVQLTGYATSSNRIATGFGVPAINSQNDFRGYIASSGKFILSPHWTLTQSARVASDRTFLRRYDISRDDRLRSTINLERIDSDSYFSLAGWAVQTLRVNDPQNQVPIALPALDYRVRFTDPVLGGKAQIQANSLAITRTGGQDTQRAFVSAQWDLRTVTKMGQDVRFTLFGRGDVYHSGENSLTSTVQYRGSTGWQARGIASAAVDVRWPLIGEAIGGTQILTPRIQLVATPTLSNLRVPNEDARAIDLEDSNLFALNRFPGYDRFEDNSRITYGLDWTLDRPNWHVDANVGQSYRLANNSTILPDGTGLSEKFSDIVGRTNVRFKDIVKLTHRFRLDKDNLAVRRNEIDATVGSRETYVQVGYLRLNRDITPTLEDLRDREEIRLGGRVQVAQYWSVFGSAIIDLTDRKEDPLSIADGYDPVRHRLGVAYDDGCLSMGLTWRYDYEDTGDARRGSTFLFRMALRNLGV